MPYFKSIKTFDKQNSSCVKFDSPNYRAPDWHSVRTIFEIGNFQKVPEFILNILKDGMTSMFNTGKDFLQIT